MLDIWRQVSRRTHTKDFNPFSWFIPCVDISDQHLRGRISSKNKEFMTRSQKQGVSIVETHLLGGDFLAEYLCMPGGTRMWKLIPSVCGSWSHPSVVADWELHIQGLPTTWHFYPRHRSGPAGACQPFNTPSEESILLKWLLEKFNEPLGIKQKQKQKQNEEV